MKALGHTQTLVTLSLLGMFGCSDPAVATDAGLDVHGDGHTHTCVGFALTPGGTATLSGLVDTMHMHDGGAHDGGLAEGSRCVAMSTDPTTGSGGTLDGAYTVEARSLRGSMTAEAPDNEGLSLTIRRRGAPVTGLDLRFYARMPHHNGRITGGHGPANDFNVNGMTATPGAPGTYVVDPIDFNMTGYWLFEARFTADGAEQRLYFAMETVAGT